MDFQANVDDILDRLGLTSSTAEARIGRAWNRHHRRISASLGLNVTRRESLSTTADIGSDKLTISGVEKVLSVRVPGRGSSKPLDKKSTNEIDEQRTLDAPFPRCYADYSATSNSVTIQFDCTPQEEFDVIVEAYTTIADLADNDNPSIAESYQDAVNEAVLADEYRRMEKLKDAAAADATSLRITAELRHFLSKSAFHNMQAGQRPAGYGGANGGGASGAQGDAAYTQTGQITFDRDPLAPFAVSASSAVVPNLDADKLDGQHGSYYRDSSNQNAGTLPDARFPSTLPALNGSALTALNATALGSGTLPDARFPATLPAISGANLTNLDASGLASGTIPNARFATGAWTPVLGGAGGTTGQSYTTQSGRYTKVGPMVTAWGNIVLSNKGTITGALQISGLPFVADSTPSHGHVFVSFWLNWGTAFVYLSGSIAASTSVATIIAAAAAATGLSGLTTSDVTNTTQITFVAHYMTAS